jgi:hypothetical protein
MIDFEDIRYRLEMVRRLSRTVDNEPDHIAALGLLSTALDELTEVTSRLAEQLEKGCGDGQSG